MNHVAEDLVCPGCLLVTCRCNGDEEGELTPEQQAINAKARAETLACIAAALGAVGVAQQAEEFHDRLTPKESAKRARGRAWDRAIKLSKEMI